MALLSLTTTPDPSGRKEPLNNALEHLNDPRCFTNLFRYSSTVNGFAVWVSPHGYRQAADPSGQRGRIEAEPQGTFGTPGMRRRAAV